MERSIDFRGLFDAVLPQETNLVPRALFPGPGDEVDKRLIVCDGASRTLSDFPKNDLKVQFLTHPACHLVYSLGKSPT